MLSGVLAGDSSEERQDDVKVDSNAMDAMDTCGFPLFSHDLQSAKITSEEIPVDTLRMNKGGGHDDDDAPPNLLRVGHGDGGFQSNPPSSLSYCYRLAGQSKAEEGDGFVGVATTSAMPVTRGRDRCARRPARRSSAGARGGGGCAAARRRRRGRVREGERRRSPIAVSLRLHRSLLIREKLASNSTLNYPPSPGRVQNAPSQL
ncbi:unnamed protein product, partial [Urochloa humidicola]